MLVLVLCQPLVSKAWPWVPSYPLRQRVWKRGRECHLTLIGRGYDYTSVLLPAWQWIINGAPYSLKFNFPFTSNYLLTCFRAVNISSHDFCLCPLLFLFNYCHFVSLYDIIRELILYGMYWCSFLLWVIFILKYSFAKLLFQLIYHSFVWCQEFE